MLGRIVFAGGDAKSFGKGARQLAELAELPITGRHVGRLTELIGQEMVETRDREVAAYQRRELPPAVANVPQAVVVETDGGRVNTRVADQGPGVHGPHWREDKVGLLCTLQSQEQANDPHEEVPRCFLDREGVPQLVQEMHTRRAGENKGKSKEKAEATPAAAPSSATPEKVEKTARWQPQRLVRTVVATLQDVHAFGPMVAAAAQKRNFFAATRAAFVADGQACNWSLQRTWFPDFIPITDLVHALSYVYDAARASAADGDFWPTYVRWITAVWQGRVMEVIIDLDDLLKPLRSAAELAVTDQTRKQSLETALTYLENNRSRMDYPRYRRLGLPIVSALVESLIKEINWRVKGSEKFWNDPAGAEAILQIRAALLSEDEALGKHLQNRQGSYYRRAKAKAA